MYLRKLISYVVLVLFPVITGQSASAIDAEKVLRLAEEAGHWIASTTIKTGSGDIWPDDALSPDKVGFDLASGVSGKVVFFVALYRATGNKVYLTQARQGADYLVSFLKDPAKLDLAMKDLGQRRASLYAGFAGVGVALLHIREEVAEPKYAQALQQVIQQLSDWGISDAKGVRWNEQFNDLLYGDAGTTLFLAHIAKRDNNPLALSLAVKGAHYLLNQAVSVKEGKYWLFRRDKDFNLPNFSHGTAGVGYVLASVAALTNDQQLSDGAKAGLKYLRSISEISDGQIRIPYGWGSESWHGRYDFGWAHGLAGTSLMLLRMQGLGLDRDHAEQMLSLARNTLANINLPGVPSEPFVEPSIALDWRFGRAGVLSIAAYWANKYPEDEKIVALRDALFDHIAAAAVREHGTAYWQTNVPEFMGGGTAAYTGLFHGAAGMGMALLNLHASLVKKRPYANMPDAPY